METLIGVPLALLFASFGRWAQFHPEKFVDGQFSGPNTRWARACKRMIAVWGSSIVATGTWGAVVALTSPVALLLACCGKLWVLSPESLQ